MVFNTYEELLAAVEDRRQDTLTVELDMGGEYSPEYEEAKSELQQAKAIRALAGDQAFMSDSLSGLEAKVESLRPPRQSVWARFSRLPLAEWSLLMKTPNKSAVDQYESVLPKTFIGLYGQDPSQEGVEVEPLTTDPAALSGKSNRSILQGASLMALIQAYMSWQGSGGDVNIHPTK